VQDTLWQSYTQGGLVAGISAMPSMHNATALLLALVGARIDWRLGILLWIHCALIFIGSIHLAWHYAVDNYVGWAIALACWWLARPVARWWEGHGHVQRLTRLIEAAAFPAGR
jgi:membrane-associated phospholipid phosphatase